MLVPAPEELLCRHCGLPADVDEVTCYAPLERGKVRYASRVHLRCQMTALLRLTEANREAARRWKITRVGWREAFRLR